jgi:hypothetical protein
MTPPVENVTRAGDPESPKAVCSVCGLAVDTDDIEDTNGWRWYSDGAGGLKPLCAGCPPPAAVEDEAQVRAFAPGRAAR